MQRIQVWHAVNTLFGPVSQYFDKYIYSPHVCFLPLMLTAGMGINVCLFLGRPDATLSNTIRTCRSEEVSSPDETGLTFLRQNK